MINYKEVCIHHDVDGVLRDFHTKADEIFFEKYPELKQYKMKPVNFKGWGWKDQFVTLPTGVNYGKLMEDTIFKNEENCYRAFYEAEPFYSTEDWKHHCNSLWKKVPNAHIVISSHQFSEPSRKATIEWLEKNGFLDGDKISVLFTKNKYSFNANYLLDDKPSTIEQVNEVGTIGVLRYNVYSNHWYLKQHGWELYDEEIPIYIARGLRDYRDIIYDTTKGVKLWDM